MVVKRPEDYEPVSAGKHLAVCARIFDIGDQPDGYKGRIQHKCVFLFELQDRRPDGQRFTLTKEYTACLADNSHLRHDLETWRGKPFTEAELKGFNLDKALWKYCLLTVVAREREGRNPFMEIEAIEPAPAGMDTWQAEVPEDYVPGWVEARLARRVDRPSGAAGGTF